MCVCSGEFRCVRQGVCVQVSSGVCDSRGLGPGGVLSELAVVDGEIRTKVAAELQRTDGAERERERGRTLFPREQHNNTALWLAARSARSAG